MGKSRRKKHVIPLKQLWVIQKELTGCTDSILPMVELANVIAAIKGWPEILERQPKYREFSKQYIIKYMHDKEKIACSNPTCWVYFIQQGKKGPIKIGVADNIDSRLASLQTGSPMKLHLLARIGCDERMKAYSLEKDLHSKFSNFRMSGEWFARSIIFYLHKIKEPVEWVIN